MNKPAMDFKPVTDGVTALLPGIDDSRMSDRTPCEEFTLGAVINHMLGLTWVFADAANKVRGPHTDSPPTAPPSAPEAEWRTVLPIRLDALAQAWAAPEAWEGEATAGGVTMPAEIMGLVALNEVTVHGWDLARATGQEYELDPEIVKTLTEFVAQDADDQAAREGIFGPAVRVPEDAPPLDRLIGLTGRDPEWSRS
ncbi:TIGR03086 family metal-binding protein [Salininema proteolyticum]|uniref:TIGR03086 family metal-binding protein n=1 Tax=Salininema proteolyticum TaxID=1607685 RepID=A0ABV8U1L4_9ACTN